MSTTITIPKNFIHGEELIVVRRSEFEQLQKKASEIDEVMETIRAGEKEIRQGKIKHTKKSISEALNR
jgi:hypothetical protein